MALMLFVAAFAQLVQPYAFDHVDLMNRMTPPVPLSGATWTHPLGTDTLGRDLLSRLLVAAQTSMLLSILGTVLGAVMGIALGFVAAHKGGLWDEVIMGLVDFQAAMPWFIIALAILAFMGNSMVIFIGIMALYGWETYARITRGLVLSAREQGYALAVRGLGGKPSRVYVHHILPNIAGPLIVQLTINFPSTILFETSLSFLGLGIRPPMTSLGQMLGDGRDYLINAWWLAVIPGMVIFLTTLSMSVLGDWLRIKLDPSLET
ncbi:Dipeptide transport system permease protein DppC [Salipiger mucosus DSM 16094]|uniref:Dipeptide transport system permease protein DppC n=2 Tax=Salipiger mucosus TaxID=263378 RepID=S9QPT8_9RHOB|nr:Dipeptide transport system permease protein DppC [Salipiger mucosus DSM 16094]